MAIIVARQGLLHTRALVATATPIAISYMAESAVLLTNTYIAGQIGVLQLAAIGLGAGILYPLTFAGAGLASTSSVLAASNAHSNSIKRRVLIAGWLLCLVAGPLLIATGLALLYALSWFGIDKSLLTEASQYTLVASPLVPAVFVFSVYRGILTTEGKNSIIAHASYLSIAVNAILAAIFVFLCDYGVIGLAASTTISTFVMVGYVMIFTGNWYDPSTQDQDGSWREIFPFCERYLKIGVPIALIGLLESGMFLVLTGIAASFGVGFMAANALAISISDIVSALAFGIGEASTARFALYRSQSTDDNHWVVYKVAVGMAAIVGLSAAIVIYSLQDLIITAFISEIDRPYASGAFHSIALTFCVFLIFDSIQSVQYRALKGIEDVRVPFLLATASYWLVGVLLGFYFSTQTQLGGHGLWVGLLAGVMTATVLLHLRSVRRYSCGDQ